MNATAILKYGHRTVHQTIDGLPESDWETEGVCGWWSVKNIIAHLASYEQVLVDVLRSFLGGGPTPCLDQMIQTGPQFNDVQVALRKDKTPAQTLAEYDELQAQTMALIEQIQEETRREPGTLPWYGPEYALDDFVVYQYYGHKREHSAQVAVFRDKVKR